MQAGRMGSGRTHAPACPRSGERCGRDRAVPPSCHPAWCRGSDVGDLTGRAGASPGSAESLPAVGILALARRAEQRRARSGEPPVGDTGRPRVATPSRRRVRPRRGGRARLQVVDLHECVVVAVDLEGARRPAEHRDRAGRVGLDPYGRVGLVDEALDWSQDQISHCRGRPARGCSSGPARAARGTSRVRPRHWCRGAGGVPP